ncbi:MAG: acyl-CoA dehydrogenase family protein, partial [bacterium]|nr:acyl-CoA dehydrogenase family protein [bacterium]
MPDVELAMTPAERDLLDRASSFARDVMAPAAAQWERERIAPASAFRTAANCGLTTLSLPQAQGGQGVTTVAAARLYEELSKTCFAFTFGLLVHNNVLRAMAQHGGSDVRDLHLSQMAEGSTVGAFCLTEPNAGSDAAAIECVSRRVAGGWRINGEKAWVTNGRIATLLMVFAQTDRAKGWRGIASYLVPTSAEGVDRLPSYDLPG